MKYLKSIAAPYKHLGIGYVPLGGVSTSNVADYLAEDIVLAVGGSWIAKRDMIAAGKFDEITDIAATARTAVELARRKSSS